MASRVSLGILAVALCALIAFLVLRRREEPALRPAPAALPAPAGTVASPATPAGPARAAKAPKAVEDPTTSREETLLRGRLLEAYEQARASGGAFAWLKATIDARPESEAERRERVFAFSLLAAAALEDPSKRGEIVTLLRSHLTTDVDPDARLSCAAAMGGAALHLHDDGARSWFWVGGQIDPAQESPDRRTLGVPLRDDLRAAWARETVPLNRMTLIQLLAEQPEPAEAEFYRAVLLDRDGASREYAVDALGSLPPSPESLAALQRVLEGDADPKPRRRALAALVSLGAVDGLVTSRLLAAAPADPEGEAGNCSARPGPRRSPRRSAPTSRAAWSRRTRGSAAAC